ncbi:RNA ligase family protein [Fimbriiglobus ruber]|uniref:RNA ligase domain-containing protein n=1 Tax=Fimbriiglobus ruber TaxID=1908690 RepID=A0A225DB95_9BACT|nr:RNA ligase family protein [Fimbriiglobus ruber]OWK34419.1 hypothetical protein FRUB_10390 [Fimbriiglobus ruber]
MQFSVRAADLARLNTLTKYPPIPTYHPLDPSTGRVLDAARRPPPGEVIATEKIDGAGCRIVLLPDASYLIGGRDNWLYARGDLIGSRSHGIVAATRPVADRLGDAGGNFILVVFGEVYGGKVTAASSSYTSKREVGYRVVDVARIENYQERLTETVDEIAAWREADGPAFLTEDDLQAFAAAHALKLAPRIARFPGRDLPTRVDQTLTFLEELLPTSRCRLDAGAGGEPEGLVVRTTDRGWVTKLRFGDYARATRRKRK